MVRGSEIKSYIYFLDENSFFNSLPRWRLKKIQKCFSSRISRLKISSFQGGSVFLSQFFFFCKSEVEEQQRRKEQEEPKPPKTLASGVCIIKQDCQFRGETPISKLWGKNPSSFQRWDSNSRPLTLHDPGADSINIFCVNLRYAIFYAF